LWPSTNVFNVSWRSCPMISCCHAPLLALQVSCLSRTVFWKYNTKIRSTRYKYFDLRKICHHRPPHVPPCATGSMTTILMRCPRDSFRPKNQQKRCLSLRLVDLCILSCVEGLGYVWPILTGFDS